MESHQRSRRPASATPSQGRSESRATRRPSSAAARRTELDWFRQIVTGSAKRPQSASRAAAGSATRARRQSATGAAAAGSAPRARPQSATMGAATAESAAYGRPQSAPGARKSRQRPSSAPSGPGASAAGHRHLSRWGPGTGHQARRRSGSEWRNVAITNPDAYDQHRKLREVCLQGNHLHPDLQPWFCPALQLHAAPETAAQGMDGAPWKRLPGNRLVAVAPLGAPAYDVPDPALAKLAGSSRVFSFGTVLSSPLSSRMHRGVAYWLLQLRSGAELIAAGDNGGTDPLLAAAASGDLEGVKQQILDTDADEWADYRRTDTHGRNALLLAARHGFMDVVKWLTEESSNQAKVREVCDLGGRTALHLAAAHGHVALTRWLCEKYGSLIDAVSWPEVSARQLRAGARRDAGTLGSGWPCDRHTAQTALHLACLNGYVQTAAALLAAAPRSAQGSFRDAQGATPLMTAVTSGHSSDTLAALVQLLCDYGVEVDAAGGQLGCTALGLIVRWEGHLRSTAYSAAKVLLQFGADPTLAPKPDAALDEQVRYKGEMGRPPLLAALFSWKIELVALLAPGGIIPLTAEESNWNPMSSVARKFDAELRTAFPVQAEEEIEELAPEPPPAYVLESESRLARMQADVTSCEELGVAARKKLREAREELARSAAEAFRRVDIDGSGTIDKTELKILCQELGIGINVRQLNAAWRWMDKDGDGRMELHEFDAWLFGDKSGDELGGDGVGARIDVALFNQFATGLNVRDVVQECTDAKAEVEAANQAESAKREELVSLHEVEVAFVEQQRREEEESKWRTEKQARINAEKQAQIERDKSMFEALGGNEDTYGAGGVTQAQVDVGHKLGGLLGNSISKKKIAMNSAAEERHARCQAESEYALRLQQLGVRTSSIDMSGMLPARAVSKDIVVKARANLHAAQMDGGRWIANLVDSEGRNGVHLCILSPVASVNAKNDKIERNDLLLRLLAPLESSVAQHAVTLADCKGETPLAMAISVGLIDHSAAAGRNWVDVCVTLVRYGATIASLGAQIVADMKVQCATKPLKGTAFGGWLRRQLEREAQALAERKHAAEVGRRRRVQAGRPASAPACSTVRDRSSASPYDNSIHNDVADLQAVLELKEIELRRINKCEKLADRARQRERQKRVEKTEQDAALQAEVQRQTDAFRYGKARAKKRDDARRRKANHVKALIEHDKKIEELAKRAHSSETARRAAKLEAQMQVGVTGILCFAWDNMFTSVYPLTLPFPSRMLSCVDVCNRRRVEKRKI